MKNNLEISNDGINVYATLTVNSHIIGKILLALFVVFLISILCYIPSTIPKDEISSFIFPLVVFGIFIFVFPVRYLLWNFFGKEHLIINTKSFSHYNEYGVFETNLKTYPYATLLSKFECYRTTNGIEYGKLVFITHNEENNLPEHLYETTVLLDIEKIKLIENEISKLYETEFNNDFNFQAFSKN